MDTVQPEISRDIYGMPSFVTLTVADLDRTIDWYVNALDFVVLFTVPDSDGNPALVHLRRWRYQDLLVRRGEEMAGGEWSIGIMAQLEQLQDLSERARTHGGGQVHGPVDTPWDTRDLHVTDPDGYTVVYTARRAEADLDTGFGAMIQEQARVQLGD